MSELIVATTAATAPNGGSGARQSSSAEKGRPGMPDRSFADGVQLPVSGDAFERVGASVAEWDARAGYQVGDGAGDEYLAGLCRGRHPGTDMDGDACQVLTGGFDLAGVQADPDFEAQGAD